MITCHTPIDSPRLLSLYYDNNIINTINETIDSFCNPSNFCCGNIIPRSSYHYFVNNNHINQNIELQYIKNVAYKLLIENGFNIDYNHCCIEMSSYHMDYDIVHNTYCGKYRNNGIYYGENVHSCIIITYNDDMVVGGEFKFYTEKKFDNFYDHLILTKKKENTINLEKNMILLIDGNLLVCHDLLFGYGKRNIVQVNFKSLEKIEKNKQYDTINSF